MCLPKTRGGMGFRDMQCSNNALVMKQARKLAREDKSQAYEVLKSRYFPNGDFLGSYLGRNPSLIWRRIWEASNARS